MRIDPKYFNLFLGICAVLAAGLIAFFTLSNRSLEKDAFRERMFAQDSLQTVSWTTVQTADTIKIADFRGQFVVLDFWANWSDGSVKSHQKLASVKNEFPDTLQVIAAAVGLQKDEVESYIQKHKFPFHFVAGSKHFSGFRVPGLPAQLIYNPEGKLENVSLGYPDESQYDSLRALITNANR
jgi:thiol-disulfide isomerase/thioredoxin